MRPEARNLYAQGQTVEQIAQFAGVSAATVYRWKTADEKAGRPWQERGTEQPFDPTALIRIYERRLMALAQDEKAEVGAFWDASIKAMNLLSKALELYGDLAQRLNAMYGFVAWAMEHGGDEDLSVVRRLVPDYLDSLKRQNE